jgi:hypothetical protein
MAQSAAEAASRAPVHISIFTSGRNDVCFDPGDVAAITKLARQEQDRINRQGGINGRAVRLQFFDDARSDQTSIANLRAALSDPLTIAMVGMSNSNRSKTTFDALDRELRESSVPFISNIAVNSIFAKYPNIFTTQASQDDERLPVMVQFIKHQEFKRVAFVGMSDAVFSAALGDGLKKQLGSDAVVADHRLKAQGEGLDRAAVAAMVADLKTQTPDMLVLGIGNARAAQVLPEIVATGITPALFITGRIDALPAEVTKIYPNAIYQLAWDRLPEADNNRLRKLVARTPAESWLFEGRKIAGAPGWAKGECKARPVVEVPDPFTSANMRAIGVGTQFADMIALVAAAGQTADANASIPDLRRHIAEQMSTTYATGKGVFKGSFENWAFQPASRVAVRTPFIVMLPQGLGRTQLAPVQFVRIKDGTLRKTETLYIDVDMVKATRVEDNDKTFFAEFFLSMRDNGHSSIDQIEFTNAFLDPKTNGRQITTEVLHGGGANAAYPEAMKVYKVAGRFTFDSDLASYPFDTQRFTIDLQPKRGDQPFIVQPPPHQLRNKAVTTDGWDLKSQYVGYDEDFVGIVDAYTHAPSVVPYYKASFVWIMKRQTTDYYLRVVVPLLFIFAVAYLSIFIPHTHFEAIVTIQVTALLSAVALYLSLPKLDADTATVSDRIFVFNYMLVSLMIVISILRVNRFVGQWPRLRDSLGLLHIFVVPAMVGAMAYFVYELSALDR